MSAALILASASPRRRELLERIGIALEIDAADIDERQLPDEPPQVYVARVAAGKADVVAARRPGRWVLAADTIVECDGAVLGKPADEREARAMLARLAARTHHVTTAVAIRGPARADRQVSTEVTMTSIHPHDLDGYVACGEWHGKAGGYAIQGIAATFVSAVRGSVTNVIGLPLAEVVALLRELGGPAPAIARGVPA